MMSFVLLVLGCLLLATRGCDNGKRIISGGLNEHEKQVVVEIHNRVRQSVALGQVPCQPPAQNMLEMVWDDELATIAQNWANQCIPKHDTPAERDVSRFAVGQNVADTWTSRPPSRGTDPKPDFCRQINAWFEENTIYTYKPYGGHGTGHYLQLVWGDSTQVGCGFNFFHDPANGYNKLYVCNYGPKGDVNGSLPYKKGNPDCSSHGLFDSQKYSGLCTTTITTLPTNIVPTTNQTELKSEATNVTKTKPACCLSCIVNCTRTDVPSDMFTKNVTISVTTMKPMRSSVRKFRNGSETKSKP